MNSQKRQLLLFLGLAIPILVLLTWLASRKQRTPLPGLRYNVQVLESLSKTAFPRAINDEGTIVGLTIVDAPDEPVPTRWELDGSSTILEVPASGVSAIINDINNHDICVGYISLGYDDGSREETRATVWDSHGKLVFTDTVAQGCVSGAYCLNDFNEIIIKLSCHAGGDEVTELQMWRYDKGSEETLKENYRSSQHTLLVYDFNDHGIAVGAIYESEGPRPFSMDLRSTSSKIRKDPSTLGWSRSINNDGVQLICLDDDAPTYYQKFLAINNMEQPIAKEPYAMIPSDINDEGTIVGCKDVGSTLDRLLSYNNLTDLENLSGLETRAFIIIDGQPYDLNDLIKPKQDRLRISDAVAINNRNVIAGQAELDGRWVVVRLVPEGQL